MWVWVCVCVEANGKNDNDNDNDDYNNNSNVDRSARIITAVSFLWRMMSWHLSTDTWINLRNEEASRLIGECWSITFHHVLIITG